MRRPRSLSSLAALGALAVACGLPQGQEAYAQQSLVPDLLAQDASDLGTLGRSPGGGSGGGRPETMRLRRSVDSGSGAASPSASTSGAGTTGFVSTPRKRPAPAAKAPSPPAAAAGRPERPKWRENTRAYDAAIAAAASRRQRIESLHNEAIAATPAETTEPFDPLGIRAGSFVLRPSIETTLGTDSNPLRTNTDPKPSVFQRYGAALAVRSDFSRHALDADIQGAFTQYDNVSGNNRPELASRLRGRLDITEQTRADLEGRYLLTTESAGDPDAPTGAVRPPPVITAGGTLGLVHRWNRLEMGLHGSFDRTTYDNAELNNGTTLDRSDRNYDQPALRLRTGYEISPGIRPFIEGEIDSRTFDRKVDFSGYERASTGRQIKAGTSFEMTRSLTGEASAGWIVRKYEDPRLPDISGLLVDGSLVWAASALTTVRFVAITTVDETNYSDTTGVFKRDLGIEVDHAFRRWLNGSIRLGWGFDDYGQAGRRDDRFVIAGLATAKLSREVWLTGEVRQERLASNLPGNDYTANIVMVGLRFQR